MTMNQQSHRQEVGYILLEECEVLVLVPAKALDNYSSAAQLSTTTTGRPLWHDVDLRCASDTNNTVGNVNEGSFAAGLPMDGCDLMLENSRENNPTCTWRNATNVIPFNGLLSEIFINESMAMGYAKKQSNGDGDANLLKRSDRPSSSESAPAKRRSDASLLAGLAIEINNQEDQYQYSCQQQQLIISQDGNGKKGNNLHLRNLRMENVQILFWEEPLLCNSEKKLPLNNTNTKMEEISVDVMSKDQVVRVKTSLLMTFSLPTNSPSPTDDLRDNQSQNPPVPKKNTKSRSKCKFLSSAHQLLGSIIRCDWGHLDARTKELEHESLSVKKAMVADNETTQVSHKQSSQKSFFPDSLNVEELYDRISGASKHFGRDGTDLETSKASHSTNSNESQRALAKNNEDAIPAISNTKQNSDACSTKRVGFLDLPKEVVPTSIAISNTKQSSDACSTKPVEFLDLPEEVVATSIATYLRARSLHALRVTNRKMYRTLRAVVPGLKLELFHHQIRSLEWMEMRERRCITEEDLIGMRRNSAILSPDRFIDEGESACGGDYHRAVSGGATVLLSPRPNGEIRNSLVQGDIRFDSESGGAVALSSDCETRRTTRCARGGLLCDDPGLGKTITVLSLILRTFGLTESTVGTNQSNDLDDDALFFLYWGYSFLTEHIRRPSLLRLISRLIKSDRESEWFVPPIDPVLDECPDYFNVISTPISLREIRIKYSKSDCKDFKAFEADVKLCFTNAMTYNTPDHVVFQAAERLNNNFEKFVAQFKSEQVKVAAKSMSRMKNEPSARSLVDAFEAKKRAELQESLVPSSSTLLVVPSPLLQHWKDQIMMHVDFEYISKDDSPPIYYHTSKRNINITSASVSSDLGSITSPFIFIDDGSRTLPPPAVLARFPIVLTSYNRFQAEWKLGSVEQEIRAANKGSHNMGNYWGEDAPEASSILKVSWLRVIVDEGHVMGKNTNNLIQFASWLTAQRHWAMTGTPTQQIATQNGLRNLYFLTNFVKHEYFTRSFGREKVWNSLIRDPWKAENLASFFRLKHITSYLMVRHTKADLIEIPPPEFSTAFINLSQSEATTYNTIVSAIRANIITTSMEGKTSGWQDSLLNPRQSKFAFEALTNLRVACCGGSQILPTILNKHWAETLEMCSEVHNLDDVKVQVVNNFIYRAQSAELSSCHNCGIQLQTLFVIPCGHLVCVECINNKTRTCPCCSAQFDVDDFQRLQPGLDNQFCLNIKEEQKEREKKYALKRAFADSTGAAGFVDIDEIENLEDEDNVAPAARARTHKRGESCVYSSRSLDGKCTTCREEHFDCNFMNSDQQCSVCFKFVEECPKYASKSKYVIDKLIKLRSNDFVEGSKICNISPMAARLFGKCRNNNSTHRPLKAIAFSQFRTAYEYFGDRLIRRFGGACVADYSYAGTRTHELEKFINSPDCFVMLLSKQGSVGLDLSFVTHIFFLDSIYDKSLEAQVVARAYRMGATGAVFVEQLTAKDSVEEVMNQINAGKHIAIDASSDQNEKQAKTHLLLKSAQLIRPPQVHRKRKIKCVEGDEVKPSGEQSNNSPNLKQAAKTGGVRFKD